MTALILALSACQQQPARPAAQANKLIPCATGTAPLAEACTVEIVKRPDGPLVIVRNPNGSFHRLQASRDGYTLEAADGAQPAIVAQIDRHTVEVTVGPDRYRLPAFTGRR